MKCESKEEYQSLKVIKNNCNSNRESDLCNTNDCEIYYMCNMMDQYPHEWNIVYNQEEKETCESKKCDGSCGLRFEKI